MCDFQLVSRGPLTAFPSYDGVLVEIPAFNGRVSSVDPLIVVIP